MEREAHIRIEDGQDQLGSDADSVGGCIQLIHETLMPRVGGTLQQSPRHVEDAMSAFAVSRQGQVKHVGQGVRIAMVNQCIAVGLMGGTKVITLGLRYKR